MYKIDNATASASLPTPAAVGPNPNGYFTKGNPGGGTPATIVDDDWANAVQEELCYVIEQSGITLDKTVRTQLLAGIKAHMQSSTVLYAASTSSPNTYTATLSPVPTGYITGSIYRIKFTNANTSTTPTMNFNSLGAKTMVRPDGSALKLADIAAGMVGLLSYDGTNIQLLNPAIDQTFKSVQMFTGSGTWTKPAGINKCLVICTAGGGGGAGGNGGNSGGGGGAGGTGIKWITAPGTTETVTIGAAGTAGTAGNPGGDGGTSSFGAHITAIGGTHGVMGGGSANGGSASGGDTNLGGSTGGAPYQTDVRGGFGGPSYWGGTGAQGWGGTGGAGQAYGAGGGGGAGSNGGGAGAAGYIVVYEYA